MTRSAPPIIPLRPAGPSVPYNPQTRVCLACGVRRHALFGVLDESALQDIHFHIADLTLAPGERLYGAHEHGSAAFTVREGVVRLERTSERGERRILRLVGASAMAGMEAMLGQAYAADAIACTPVRACRLPRVLVDELARDRPELLRNLMKRWQGALDEADEWLTEMTAGSARWRMLRLLLKLSEYGTVQGGAGGDERIWLPSRQEMAAMLAMTVETASRLVSALRREGLFETVDAHHVRLDMQALLAALKRAAAENG
jgi:CRP-like cAMP-binding protein